MSTIASLCRKIVENLTRLGIHTADDLLPGASEQRIQELSSELPFPLPRSLVDLYKWSEGVPVEYGKCSAFFPGYGFESFQYMIETYRDLSNASEFPRFRSGDLCWFPVFRSSGTDYYGISCTDAIADDAEIVNDDNEGAHRDGVTPPRVEFNSLEAMLKTLLRAYELGVYYVDDEGVLACGAMTYFDDGPYKGSLKEVDISRFKEIARQLNPGLECWD